jgi:hypothetical protein
MRACEMVTLTQRQSACMHAALMQYQHTTRRIRVWCVGQTDACFVPHTVLVSQTVIASDRDARKLGMQTLLALLALCPPHLSQGSSEVLGDEDKLTGDTGFVDLRDVVVEELALSLASVEGMRNAGGGDGEVGSGGSSAGEIADECIKPLLPLILSPLAGECRKCAKMHKELRWYLCIPCIPGTHSITTYACIPGIHSIMTHPVKCPIVFPPDTTAANPQKMRHLGHTGFSV